MSLSSSPSSSSYAYMSNHVVVNQERTRHGVSKLMRCAILDEMARGKAQEMAKQQRLLQPYNSDTMVENVQCGPSLKLMHQLIMHGLQDNPQRKNILDPRFVKFGMGVAKSTNGGVMYISQLFQGPPPPRPRPSSLSSSSVSVSSNMPTTTNHQSHNSYHDSTSSTGTRIVKNARTRIIPSIDKYIPDITVLEHRRRSCCHQNDS